MVSIISKSHRVISEIQTNLFFKSDDTTLKHYEKLKETNKEYKHIINWVEEYSSLNAKQKDLSNVFKKNNYFSNKPVEVPIIKNSYLSNYLSSMYKHS